MMYCGFTASCCENNRHISEYLRSSNLLEALFHSKVILSECIVFTDVS